jgi:peroxiredoxin
MANLTGEFDVAAEISVNAVNRVLAAVHENESSRYPVLPHSLTMVVDDTPRGGDDPVPISQRTGVRARVELQLSAPTVSLPQGPVVTSHISVAPMRSAFGTSPDCSPGSTSIAAPGSPFVGPTRFWPSSNISIQVGLRAWIQGSPEPALPQFVHGTLIVNATLVRTSLDPVVLEATEAVAFGPPIGPLFGGTFVGLDRSAGLSVSFMPAAGTTVADEERGRIQQIVHNALRSDFRPVTFQVTTPEGVRNWDFRLDANHASVRLMMLLTPRSISPSAAATVSAGLIPFGDDFAIGVGRDYLLDQLNSLLLNNLPGEFGMSGTGVSGKIRPDWNASGFDLQPGRIVLTVTGSGGITYGAYPFSTTDEFTFTIRQALTLAVIAGGLEPLPDGDPQVDLHGIFVFESFIEGKARSAIRTVRDQMLAANRTAIRKMLEVQRPLKEIIGTISPSPAGVNLTNVQIRSEGAIASGRIGLAPSRPVVVRHVRRNGMIDALESWIPGGIIDRFAWSDEQPVFTPLILPGGVGVFGPQRIEEHRFATEDAAFPTAFTFRCLDVSGRRLTSNGTMVAVSGHTCGFYVPIAPWPVVKWPVKGGRAMPALPLPGVKPDGSPGIVGHFSPWGSGLAPADGPTTMVVHFADRGWEETAADLVKAIEPTREAAVVVVVLLRAGALVKARPVTLASNAAFVVGEDVEDHWATALQVTGHPATVIVNSGGTVVFREHAPLSESRLSGAIAEHARPGGRVSWQRVQLGVLSGAAPPDAPFRYGGGAELSLRRLRGRPVVVAFWTSWSEPSLEQLRQLRAAYESSARDGVIVLAVGDGEPAERAEEVARRERLPFPVIADPNRGISQRFGVGVWPSTVWIAPDMRVDAVHLGLTAIDCATPPRSHSPTRA